MLMEEQLQREIVKLLNKWSEGYETALLELLVAWTEKNLISPYKIVYYADNYGKSEMWVMEKK